MSWRCCPRMEGTREGNAALACAVKLNVLPSDGRQRRRKCCRGVRSKVKCADGGWQAAVQKPFQAQRAEVLPLNARQGWRKASLACALIRQ